MVYIHYVQSSLDGEPNSTVINTLDLSLNVVI